jgi:DsbC/DsbD-like thiol-disulfide interchange protein
MLVVNSMSPAAASASWDDDTGRASNPVPSKTHARLEVSGSSSQIEPNHGILLGAHLTMDAGWHIYWDGQNDSGLPPTFTFELPAGWSVEALPWLPPTRHVTSGDIVDHIYEGSTTMLFRVFAPQNARVGASVPIVVRSKWLVCEEACIPEQGEARWTLSVVSAEKQSPAEAQARKRLMNVLASLPTPLSKVSNASVEAIDGKLTIRVPGATHLTFLPDARSVRALDMVQGVEASGDVLVVRMAKSELGSGDELVPLARVGGLVGVRLGEKAVPSVTDPSGTLEHWYSFEALVAPADAAGEVK